MKNVEWIEILKMIKNYENYENDENNEIMKVTKKMMMIDDDDDVRTVSPYIELIKILKKSIKMVEINVENDEVIKMMKY